jgi:galactonate dehydratase
VIVESEDSNMQRRSFFSTLFGAASAAGLSFREAAAQSTGARPPKLKIKEVRAARMRNSVTNYVRVYTDQGLTGTGEMVDNVGADLIVNNNLGPSLAGQDPLNIEAIYDSYLGWQAPVGGIAPVFMRGMGGPYLTAMSGLDLALWDLAGKAYGVPLYRLFGGAVRSKIAVYHHASTPDQARQIMAQSGVRAIKTSIDAVTASDNDKLGWDPGRLNEYPLTNPQIDDIVRHVGWMREAVGAANGLALECHTRYDTESAIQIAKAVEQFRPMWLEEPVTSDNVEAMLKVRNATRIPIAAGENIYTRYGFRPFLEKQALSLIQMDMTKCGGLLESRKIAAMAEIYHIPISPHGVASTLGKVAFGHVCATVPNFMILEWMYGRKERDVLTDPAQLKDGFLTLPEKPGIGIELVDDAVKEALAPGSKML